MEKGSAISTPNHVGRIDRGGVDNFVLRMRRRSTNVVLPYLSSIVKDIVATDDDLESRVGL